VIATVARLVAHELKHRAKLLVELPPDLPPVRVGPARLEQVLVNLLVNAAQALEGIEGLITIRARRHAGDRIVVDVIDNGPGIPPAILARLFEPFFTTKAATSGTGLGLAISQSIVADAGGDLSVESAPGRGTTFRITLPVAHERPVQLVEPPPRQSTRRKILVIDDEPSIVGSLSSLLGVQHDVETLTSARNALAMLRTGATYDVILCDLMMPEVTGMDVHEQLAHARPGEEAKLVFMTGGAFTDRARAFLANVPNRCLEKPFKIGELEDLLSELLGRAP
jgi:CheY-like chemotaxis protein/anti-sigma regulatory factor (Ser/Thr protein kinase)